MSPIFKDKDLNLTPEGAEALNGLLKLLRWERDHAIHFAVVNLLSIRDKIVEQVQEFLAEDNIQVVSIELSEPVYNLLDIIQEQAPPICFRDDSNNEKRAVMFIFGLEDTFDSSEHRDAALFAMNVQREKYRDIFRCPMVFWLRQYALEIIANEAPDFWTWRSGVYNLDTERRELEDTSMLSLYESDKFANLSAEEKISRRNELRTLLDEYESRSDADKPDILKIRGGLLQRIGDINYSLQQYEQARDAYNRSLEIFRKLDNQKEIRSILSELGRVAMFQKNYDEAWKLLEESLNITKQLKDNEWMAKNLHDLAWVAQHQGDYPKAQKFCQESLDIAKKFKNNEWIAKNIYRLGRIAQNQGHYAEAGEFYRQSLKVNEELGNYGGIGANLYRLGEVAQYQSNYAEGNRFYREGLEIARRFGDNQYIAAGFYGLGEIAQYQGDYEKAKMFYQRSLEIDRQLGNNKWAARKLYHLGQIAYNLKDYEQAFRNIRESIQIIKDFESDDQKRFQEQLEEVKTALGEEKARILEENLEKQQLIEKA
jgi:tetratricopeptide (TPR) repeat protein